MSGGTFALLLDDRFACYNMIKYNFTNQILQKGENTMLFLPKEEGQGLVEYALILVLVAVVVIAILMLLGPIIGDVFSDIVAGLGG